MKKLVQGIIDFRREVLPEYRDKFAKLALGQSPDTLFIACSDSRVVPNLFASTDPGDLFVVRNVGNLIPPCDSKGMSLADQSEAAAIEFAVEVLGVKDIVICGHSECGAMQAIMNGREKIEHPNLREWLRHGHQAPSGDDKTFLESPSDKVHNTLSQLNVLRQLENLKTYPAVMRRLSSGAIQIHGWFFDIASASVHSYSADRRRFELIAE